MLSRFYGLYDRNKDIGGWIKIDGTNVNYPVMKDTRNQFYRDHNYDRRYSPYGVPYFDSTAALVNAQSVNRTLTIYGNNLQDGQMFSDVVRYRELDFLIQHPLVEMNTLFTNGKWVPLCRHGAGSEPIRPSRITARPLPTKRPFLSLWPKHATVPCTTRPYRWKPAIPYCSSLFRRM